MQYICVLGEKCEVTLEVYVDKKTACLLNSGQDKLDDILVLHLLGGKDLFITVGFTLRSYRDCTVGFTLRSYRDCTVGFTLRSYRDCTVGFTLRSYRDCTVGFTLRSYRDCTVGFTLRS